MTSREFLIETQRFKNMVEEHARVIHLSSIDEDSNKDWNTLQEILKKLETYTMSLKSRWHYKS